MRYVVVVLGMHRSGTSALTRVLNRLGADLPRTLMPTHEDNVMGYWESPDIAKFNNRLLKALGTSWDSDAGIEETRLRNTAEWETEIEEARLLIRQQYGNSSLFVLKDPRICRLFPFWEHIFRLEGLKCKIVLCQRDPAEVASSLARRCEDPLLLPAGIRCPSRAFLLWLRYVLDAERSTRHLDRIAVNYGRLLSDWRTELRGVSGLCSRLALPAPGCTQAAEIDAFLRPELNRQRSIAVADELRESISWLLEVLNTIEINADSGKQDQVLDSFSSHTDGMVDGYSFLRRDLDRGASEDIWAARILGELVVRCPHPRARPRTRKQRRSILFITRNASSRAHEYRVIHPVEELIARGWFARWTHASDISLVDAVTESDVVVVSRGPWGDEFDKIRKVCSARKIKLLCDIDDLIFDEAVLDAGSVEYFNNLSVDQKDSFLRESADCRRAISSCDGVLATTAPLRRAAARYSPRTFLLPNCLGRRMLAAAEACRVAHKPSSSGQGICIGFASGTPTHQRDFNTIAPVLGEILQSDPNVRLVILGYLNLSAIPELDSCLDQVEHRPLVPLHRLPEELIHFDINLVPLNTMNPFNEAKSEIRFTAASSLGIPSITANTEPLRGAVIDGVTGFIARDRNEWRLRIHDLVNDPSLRSRMGQAALIDTTVRFGPEKTGAMLEQVLEQLELA